VLHMVHFLPALPVSRRVDGPRFGRRSTDRGMSDMGRWGMAVTTIDSGQTSHDSDEQVNICRMKISSEVEGLVKQKSAEPVWSHGSPDEMR
jgi:hypothetical protein